MFCLRKSSGIRALLKGQWIQLNNIFFHFKNISSLSFHYYIHELPCRSKEKYYRTNSKDLYSKSSVFTRTKIIYTHLESLVWNVHLAYPTLITSIRIVSIYDNKDIKIHIIQFILSHNCRLIYSTYYCNFGHNTCIWSSSGIFNLKETQPAPLFAAHLSNSAEEKILR